MLPHTRALHAMEAAILKRNFEHVENGFEFGNGTGSSAVASAYKKRVRALVWERVRTVVWERRY